MGGRHVRPRSRETHFTRPNGRACSQASHCEGNLNDGANGGVNNEPELNGVVWRTSGGRSSASCHGRDDLINSHRLGDRSRGSEINTPRYQSGSGISFLFSGRYFVGVGDSFRRRF